MLHFERWNVESFEYIAVLERFENVLVEKRARLKGASPLRDVRSESMKRTARAWATKDIAFLFGRRAEARDPCMKSSLHRIACWVRITRGTVACWAKCRTACCTSVFEDICSVLEAAEFTGTVASRLFSFKRASIDPLRPKVL